MTWAKPDDSVLKAVGYAVIDIQPGPSSRNVAGDPRLQDGHHRELAEQLNGQQVRARAATGT